MTTALAPKKRTKETRTTPLAAAQARVAELTEQLGALRHTVAEIARELAEQHSALTPAPSQPRQHTAGWSEADPEDERDHRVNAELREAVRQCDAPAVLRMLQRRDLTLARLERDDVTRAMHAAMDEMGVDAARAERTAKAEIAHLERELESINEANQEWTDRAQECLGAEDAEDAYEVLEWAALWRRVAGARGGMIRLPDGRHGLLAAQVDGEWADDMLLTSREELIRAALEFGGQLFADDMQRMLRAI